MSDETPDTTENAESPQKFALERIADAMGDMAKVHPDMTADVRGLLLMTSDEASGLSAFGAYHKDDVTFDAEVIGHLMSTLRIVLRQRGSNLEVQFPGSATPMPDEALLSNAPEIELVVKRFGAADPAASAMLDAIQQAMHAHPGACEDMRISVVVRRPSDDTAALMHHGYGDDASAVGADLLSAARVAFGTSGTQLLVTDAIRLPRPPMTTDN